MSSTLETAPCKEYLPDVYRFAFLMTGNGDAAAEVLRRTVERAARGGIGNLRDPRRVKRWLFAEARQHCGGPLPTGPLPPVPGGNEPEPAPLPGAGGNGNGNGSHPPAPAAGSRLPATPAPTAYPTDSLAAAFGALPERERSALILFYLYLFSPADLAETLELKADTLGPILAHGRALLTREMDKPPLPEGGGIPGIRMAEAQPASADGPEPA